MEEFSDQIEITHENIAHSYVEYCEQIKKVNESKIDYIERMQQPLNSDKPKEEFRKIIRAQATKFGESK